MNNYKKTKVIATVGPATNNIDILAKMSNVGMNIARINFSHEQGDSALPILENIRAAEKKSGRNISILQDLSGPKIRTGKFVDGEIILKKGKKATVVTKKIIGTEEKFTIDYKNLLRDVKKGHRILLNDGKQELLVTKATKDSLEIKVVTGGFIRDRRGVNLPDSEISISALTKKDKEDVKFGIKHKVEFIAFSFVNTGKDVRELRSILNKSGSEAMIISKIETPTAIKNFDEILLESDAIMVARGDLAVEVELQRVPKMQKDMIRKCNAVGKPVITATQMMDSMINSPVPTRAEVSDISNAILDGTDAIMLSEETAMGKYPVKAIGMMQTIALEVESTIDYKKFISREYAYRLKDFVATEDAVTRYAAKTAEDIDAKLIIALTESGTTARMIARYKPEQEIFVVSPSENTLRQCSLSFGTHLGMKGDFKQLTEAIETTRK
jgi:pyruvate kinase